MESLYYVECPRDAWQGLPQPISSHAKRQHLQNLIQAGFRQLDLASFVSPKAVPQMADSEQVLAELERPPKHDFLAIVANMRGLARALTCPAINQLGYPLSVNERFQQANSGKNLAQSWQLLAEMQDALAVAEQAQARPLELVVYISMGFGNPYDDPESSAWQAHDSAELAYKLRAQGIKKISLADTVGKATPETIAAVLEATEQQLGSLDDVGLHLHARADNWQPLLEPALARGIRWLEGALAGQGGCPFAGDALVGNIPSEQVLPWLAHQGYDTGIALEQLPTLSQQARALAHAEARG